MKIAILALAAAATLSSATPALARDRDHGYGGYRGHSGYSGHGGYSRWHGYRGHDYRPRVGFYLGAPLLWPSFDYYHHRPYTTTQVVVQREPEVVYLQREVPAAQPAAATDFWYFCPDTKTYYPYTQSCPSGWLQVVPQTSPQVPR